MQLHRLAKENDIDIVHVNDLYNLSAIRARKMGAQFKLVTHVRLLEKSMPSKLYSYWKRMHKKHSDRIICVSNPCFAPFSTFPNAAMIHDRHPADEQLPGYHVLDRKPLKVLYLGNYMRGKGHDIALQAFNIALKSYPDLELQFYGSDMDQLKNREFKSSLEDTAKAHGIESKVHFHNATSNVEETMKKHDLVLNCSEIESFSLVCQEALFYGVPLISTNSGGPADQISNGENGFLVDDFDPTEIAEALVELAKNEKLRNSFSSSSQQRVRSEFGPGNTSEKLADTYREVLS